SPKSATSVTSSFAGGWGGGAGRTAGNEPKFSILSSETRWKGPAVGRTGWGARGTDRGGGGSWAQASEGGGRERAGLAAGLRASGSASALSTAGSEGHADSGTAGSTLSATTGPWIPIRTKSSRLIVLDSIVAPAVWSETKATYNDGLRRPHFSGSLLF